MTWQDRCRVVGQYLGYPECCIEAFIASNSVTPLQREASQRTGFVPCVEHAALVIGSADPAARLAALVRDRKCAIPFPHARKERA